MLHILILKILGIILLVILGILFVILLTILFLPLRYRLKAFTDGGVEKLSVNMRITWFFHLLSGGVKYEKQEADINVRLAWKRFNINPKVKKKKREEPELKEKKERKFGNIKCTIVKIYDSIKMICETKEKAIEFLTDKVHLTAFDKVKNEISKLAKRIRPKKIKGFVRFGLKDPYNTGQVLAVLSVLYPFYGEHIEIYPEFEQEILEGNIVIEGKMMIFHLLCMMCKIIFNKNILKTYKDFKSFKQ